MKTRIIALALILIMSIGSVAFAQIDPLNQPEKLTLNIGVLQGHTQSDSEMEKFLEERYNIDINLIVYPGWSDGQSKISMLMADADQRPDLYWWWGMDSDYVQWVQAELLVDVTDYSNTYTNIRDYYNKMDPMSLFYASYDDGRLYRIPGDVSEPSCEVTWIRKDWLDNLGLSVPTTTEELVEVLRAFTEDDPDGNGVKDTYGLGGDGYDFRSFWPFIQGYNDTHYADWVLLEDGSIAYGPSLPATKEWLAQVADLYAKGYITPNIITDTDREEEMAKGGYGVTYSWIAWNNIGAYEGITSYTAAHPEAEWTMINMVTGPNGNPQEDPASSAAWCYIGITDVNPDPERTYAIIDDMASIEMYKRRWFGVEGEHYVINENGQYDPIISWASPENADKNIGLQIFTSFVNRKDEALISNNPVTLEWFNHSRDFSRDFAAKLVRFKNSANFTTWNENGSEIEDAVKAYFWGVIAGTRSIDEWDSYIATIDALGYPECLEQANELYAAQRLEEEAYFAE